MNDPTQQQRVTNIDIMRAACAIAARTADSRQGPFPDAGFLATAAVGGAVLGGLSWASLAAADESELPMPSKRSR